MSCYVLAAIGLRTLFDKTYESLKIDPNLSFKDKLNGLIADKLIGEMEKDIFAVLTDAGSAAAYRRWEPSLEDLDVLLTTIEQFLYRA